MAKAKTPEVAQKPAVVAVSNAVGNVAVIDKLNVANEAAATADQFAREAAIAANNSDYLDIAVAGDRLDKILELYKGQLTRKSVKESFSAALAVLVADKPVRIAASEKTEKADGTIRFGAAEALPPVADKAEVLPEGKAVTELSAADAIAKLQTGTLKQAATAAREAIGKARAAGGGRKAAVTEKRAPFFDELSAVLNDKALCASAFGIIGTAAKTHPNIRTAMVDILVANGYEVKHVKKD